MRMIRVSVNLSALGRTKWYEYLLRFVFGGAVTALVGIIAKRFGPEIGGLVLAFPAIFPASATRIEKHEKEKKRKAGIDGTQRGREAAGLDAAGAALGSIGLIAFALVVWRFIDTSSAWLVLTSATFACVVLSCFLGYLRKIKLGLRNPRRS